MVHLQRWMSNSFYSLNVDILMMLIIYFSFCFELFSACSSFNFWFHSIYMFRQQCFAKFNVINWSRRYFFVRKKIIIIWRHTEHLKMLAGWFCEPVWWCMCLCGVRCAQHQYEFSVPTNTYERSRKGEWTLNWLEQYSRIYWRDGNGTAIETDIVLRATFLKR